MKYVQESPGWSFQCIIDYRNISLIVVSAPDLAEWTGYLAA